MARGSAVTVASSVITSTISTLGRAQRVARRPVTEPWRASDLPLFRWGTKLRRRAAAVAALACGLAATIALPLVPALVWNVSASAPIGLYAVSGDGRVEVADMVIARVPEPYRLFAARRRYLPANVPLVKRVAAVPGDSVCAVGEAIIIDGRRLVPRKRRDGAGRPMPWWSGCVTLRNGALLLLMDDPASFDGRYFGPTEAGDVVGKARLIWAR